MDCINNTYKVYVKTDENGVIIAVNSSAFLSDTIGWTEIAEGTGDRFHHAQVHFLTSGLWNEYGVSNYKLVDGKPVLRTDEEKQPEIDRIITLLDIKILKLKLAATDYIAAKLAEGVATTEEYAEELAQRAEWRARINELEVT